MIEKNTNLGSVNISLDVVSTVAGGAATECYGVVGMASQKKLKDGFYELLKKENYSKGIIASDGETGLILDLYIILGALSGIFVIFPRFIMHKAITTLGDQDAMESVKDKSQYSFIKLVALNLTSIAGFVQVLMLIAVIFKIMDLFTIGYFILNFMVMVVSLKNIFNDK